MTGEKTNGITYREVREYKKDGIRIRFVNPIYTQTFIL